MAAVRRALALCLKHRSLLLRGRGAGPARGEAVESQLHLQEGYGETTTTETTRTGTKQSDPYFATSVDARAIWPKIVAQRNTSWHSIRRRKRRGRRSRNRFATGVDVQATGLAIVAQQNTWSIYTKRIERPSVPQDFFRKMSSVFGDLFQAYLESFIWRSRLQYLNGSLQYSWQNQLYVIFIFVALTLSNGTKLEFILDYWSPF
jgi:hypothetical protein